MARAQPSGSFYSRNTFAIWVTLVAVVLLVVGTLVTVQLNTSATEPAPIPTSSSVDETTGAIVFGDGPNQVEEHLDFMCPFCKQYTQGFGKHVLRSLDAGDITLNVHPIAILDAQSQGKKYSTRAANAMYCAAEADSERAYSFLELLFEKQPREGTEGLSDKELLAIAQEAGISSAGMTTCVEEQSYSAYVKEQTEKTPINPEVGGISTPTILVNGEFINPTGSPREELLDRLDK